jgi:hypothetical protein
VILTSVDLGNLYQSTRISLLSLFLLLLLLLLLHLLAAHHRLRNKRRAAIDWNLLVQPLPTMMMMTRKVLAQAVACAQLHCLECRYYYQCLVSSHAATPVQRRLAEVPMHSSDGVSTSMDFPSAAGSVMSCEPDCGFAHRLDDLALL